MSHHRVRSKPSLQTLANVYISTRRAHTLGPNVVLPRISSSSSLASLPSSSSTSSSSSSLTSLSLTAAGLSRHLLLTTEQPETPLKVEIRTRPGILLPKRSQIYLEMASQDDTAADQPTSRLTQMRMRFQQKTHEEKELRKKDLNASLGQAAPRAASTRPVGNGKVRQMFDERRRGAGIDRSNPLRPIGDGQQQIQQQQLIKGISTLGIRDKPIAGRNVNSDSNNNSKVNSVKYNISGTVTNRLKPIITHKTPPSMGSKESLMRGAAAAAAPATKSPLGSAVKATTIRPSKPETTTTPMARRHMDVGRKQSPATVVDGKSRGNLTSPKSQQVNPKSPVTRIQMSQPPPEGTSSCRYCGRHFITERLEKHETVCQRTMKTKRKIFDAAKMRIKGTDTEQFTKHRQKMPRAQSTYSSAAQPQGLTTGVKKNNWRKKHEEFIQAIRAAKEVKAHLARGGKLSDLPPPPPSENPDYIQCPHCNRRFNEQAAERHIPRCATMIHNKPRRSNPQPVKKR